jgi:hypothetical protein
MKHLLLLLMFALPAFAATSGQLPLKGSVPAVVSIAVSALPIASTLPLNVTQNRTRVGTSTETWNTLNGAKVHISSLNQGFLVHQSVTSSKIAYVFRYRNTNVNLASGQTFNTNQQGRRTANRALRVSYTGVPHSSLIEGDYTDIITLSISAN